MILRRLLLLVLCSACAAPLPSLPEGETTREPTTIEGVGEPLQLVAGDWGALSLQVLDQFGEPMSAQTVTARVVKAADQSPPLSFGLGNSCTTAGAPAQCAIDLRSEGPAGVFDLVLSSGGAADLSQAITVGTDRSSLSLQLTRPDQAEPALWRPGGGDGLAAQAPLSLYRGEGSRSLAVRLVDAFDNPLPAQVLQVEAAEAQAASLALHGGEGCPEDLSLGAQAEAAFGEDGLLRLCVAAGSQLGASEVLLTLPGLSEGAVATDEGGAESVLRLRLSTEASGQLELVLPGADDLRLSCPVGGQSEPILVAQVLEVVGEERLPVLGQRVLARVEGLVAALPEEQVSDEEGRVRFRAQCPDQRTDAGRLILALPDGGAEVSVPVDVAVGAAAQLTAAFENADGLAPWAVRVGSPRRLELVVSDALGNRLAGVPFRLRIPEAALADRLVLAEAACGAEVGAQIHSLNCESGDDGSLSLSLQAEGSLLGRSLPLELGAVGSNGTVSRTVQLTVLTGEARHLRLSPEGQAAAIVGALGSPVVIRVEDAGGNGVAGHAVTVEAAADLLMSQSGALTTNAQGDLSLQVLNVLSVGEHALVVRSEIAGESQERQLIFNTQAGQAEHFELRDAEGLLLCAAGGSCSLAGAVASSWPALELRLRNGAGGVLGTAFGISISRLGGEPPACDALSELASAQVSAENGNLAIAGLGGISARFGQGAQLCIYRIEVAGLSFELQVEQSPGPPSGGVFERNIGSLEAPEWEILEPNAELAGLPAQAAQPAQQPPFHQSHHLRVVAPRDAFLNPLPAGTVLPPGLSNAWGYPELPRVGAEDPAVWQFFATGGPQLAQGSVVSASGPQGWNNGPRVRFLSEQGAPQLAAFSRRGWDRKSFGALEIHGAVQAGTDSTRAGTWAVADFYADRDLLHVNDNEEVVNEDPEDEELQLRIHPDHVGEAQFVEISLWGVSGAPFSPLLPDGRCNDAAENAQCSQLRVTWLDDGSEPLAEPKPVLARLPLEGSTGQRPGGGVETRYVAMLPISVIRWGGVFGLAVESPDLAAPGETLVSHGLRLHGPPKLRWRARGLTIEPPHPLDRGGEAAAIWRRYESQQEDCLALAEGEEAELACRKIPQQWRGFARIMHVEPVQLDEDAEQELLVCGDDAFGGWIAVIDPNMDRARRGANPLGERPLQALPTYTAPAPLGEAVAWAEAKRFMFPPADSSRYCQVVEQAMGRNWVLSPGLPGSDRNPVPELVLTPLEGLRLGAPQVLALRGLRPEAYTQLAWARWEEEEGAVSGPVLRRNDEQTYGFIASVGPEGGAQLSSARPVNVDIGRNYPAIAFDGDGDRWSESCSTPNTGLSHCSTQRPAEEDWQGGEATVAQWPGTLAAQVRWGERAGLIAFQRHANRLAWYDLRRRLAPCSPSAEGPGCPEPVCGDGELQREEICEPGVGCSDECTLAELPTGAPAAGLAIPFAPATFATDQGEVGFLQGLTVNPMVTLNEATRGSGNQTANNYGTWYDDRVQCRRWGGDLPSERQYEWIATGGAGPLARRYPWGDSPPHPASAMYSGADLRSSRAGSHWLGTSVEGLADLAGSFESRGHWVLDDTSGSAPSGLAPQRGPRASQDSNPPKKGGSKAQGIGELPSGARDTYHHRDTNANGVGRCVWSVFSP